MHNAVVATDHFQTNTVGWEYLRTKHNFQQMQPPNNRIALLARLCLPHRPPEYLPHALLRDEDARLVPTNTICYLQATDDVLWCDGGVCYKHKWHTVELSDIRCLCDFVKAPSFSTQHSRSLTWTGHPISNSIPLPFDRISQRSWK